jgi:hypothetical protein
MFSLEVKKMDLMWKLKIKNQIMSMLSNLNLSVTNHGLPVLQFYYSRRLPQFIPNLKHIQLILHIKQQTLFNRDLELSLGIKILDLDIKPIRNILNQFIQSHLVQLLYLFTPQVCEMLNPIIWTMM